MNHRLIYLLVLILSAAFSRSGASGADAWVSGTDAAVVTNNDCGYISVVHGKPIIVKSFQLSDSGGTPALVTDKINSGDEVRVPDGGRLEVISPSNVVVVFGPGARVRFAGMRLFENDEGREVSRLDLDLFAGEFRVQVRRNAVRPEMVFVSSEEADFLITGGDVCFSGGAAWNGTVLSGGAQARLRRGRTVGAPFSLDAGRVLNQDGRTAIGDEGRNSLISRLPFSFESIRAALPPQPSIGYEQEAP